MLNNRELVFNIGVILLGLALDILLIYNWRKANRRRAAQGISPLTARDLWPAFKLWLSHPSPVLLTGLEISALICLSIIYSYPLVNLDPDLILLGETEVLTGIAMPVVEAFHQSTEFPLWNPYVQNGKSLIADPFLFVFNPFVSFPMFLLGVNNGAKIAAAIAFALAGVGMWTLMNVLNTRGPARLWCGATYMLAGGMPAHLWGGHFQLAIGLAWVPWCFAGILYALEKRTRWSIALAALSPALLFLTGNLYIPLYVLIGLVILFVTYVSTSWETNAVWKQVQVFIIAGIFALGLIAIQLLPEWSARSYIAKDVDPHLTESQTASRLLTNYLIGDPEYYGQTSLGNLRLVQENYNYIGVMPFVLLLFLAPAARRRRHIILVFVVYFALMIAWGSAKFSPIRYAFSAFPFLYHFQFHTRTLRVGAFALVLLAGLGLEEVWLQCRAFSPWPTDPLLNRIIRALLAIGMLAVVISSIVHLYQTNRALLVLIPRHQQMDQALSKLASYDSSEYTIANYATPYAGSYASYKHHHRLNNEMLGWTVAASDDGLAPGSIHAEPKYVIVPAGKSVAVQSESSPQLVEAIHNLEIWYIPDVLLFAFTVPHLRVQEAHTPLRTARVAEQKASRPTVNEIQVLVANAEPGDLLIVLESWFPGWRVSVDGQPDRLSKVDHFLSVYLRAGEHTVTFRYDPPAFKIGLMISIGTMCVMVAYVLAMDRWLLHRFIESSS